MTTLRFTFLTLVVAFFLSLPCVAQEPRRGNTDPFGGNHAVTDDPFNRGAKRPQRSRGSAQATRVTPREVAKAGDEKLTPEQQLRRELDSKTSVRFIESPLSDAVMQLSQAHDIPLLIDNRALEEIGLSSQEPVNLTVVNVSLRSALRLMLAEHELTHVIRDEVLIITTQEAAEQNLSPRVFLLPESLKGNEDEVIRAVQATVVPDIWDVSGGPATNVSVKDTLVVSATERVLEEVDALLDKISTAMKTPTVPKSDPKVAR